MRMRFVRLCAVLLLCFVVSCSDRIFEPEREPDANEINWSAGIWYFDSASDGGRILLRWRTGRAGWVSPPPDLGVFREPQAVGRVVLLMSTESLSGEFIRVAVHDRDGPDSVWVEDVASGVHYFFRLVTYDPSRRRLLGRSATLMSTSGPVPVKVNAVAKELPWMSISTPAWSPDGRHLAYVRPTDSGTDGYEHNVCVFDIETATERQLTLYTGTEHHVGSPTWSPDGVYIAYEYSSWRTFGTANNRIWRTPADRFAAVPITGGRVDFDPAWARDGSIIFCRGSHGPPNIPEVFLASPAQWTPQQLTFDQRARKYHPSANPENGRIVYSAVGLGSLIHHLYTVDQGGGQPRQLMGGEYWLNREPMYWTESEPVWAPDGRRVIFSSDRSGHFEIWSFDTVSEAYTQLTRGMEDHERTAGALSPDGKLLAYWEEPRYTAHASLIIARLAEP